MTALQDPPSTRSQIQVARLLPPAARGPVGVGLLVAVVGFVGLAFAVAGMSVASPLDGWVYGVLSQHHSLRSYWLEMAVAAGEPATVVVVAAIVAVVAAVARRYRLALLAVAGPGLTGLATTVLKPLLGRTIGGTFAFPSGHTAGATSIGLVLVIAIAGLAARRQLAVLGALLVALVPAVGVVALGLVAENAHYPTDTLGGFLVAGVATLGSALLIDRRADVVR